jgi:peptidyl-prolyl cis-trans isomerase A (cyclophilin A)
MEQHRRHVLGLLAGLPFAGGAGVTLAQTPAPQVTRPPPAPGPRVRLETGYGAIVIEVVPDRAPITAGNFLRYVDENRMEGAEFYRAIGFPALAGYGLLQGGLNGKGKKMLPPIEHEPTTVTGLSHGNGAVSLARTKPGTATCELFICLGDMASSLDAAPGQPGDNLGYACFGRVVEGLDVVKAIHRQPVSPTRGEEWGMKGQMLEPTIPITSVKRAV